MLDNFTESLGNDSYDADGSAVGQNDLKGGKGDDELFGGAGDKLKS